MSRQKIVLAVSKDIVISCVPNEWEGHYVIMKPDDFYNFDYNPELHEIYPIGDRSYDVASEIINNPELGFCLKLSEICNNKFVCRQTLNCMKDIPYTICNNNIINWPEDPDTQLIAKPVGGSGSNGVHKVKHGDSVPDIGENYIVELYIDDKYTKVTMNGYIFNGEIGILCVCENIYKQDEPTKFDYFKFSKDYKNRDLYSKIKEKYISSISELHNLTGCNNQLIEIEFFIIDDKIKIMEINPRLGVNQIPLMHQICGYCPWKALENIYNNKHPEISFEPRNGIVLYNYLFDNEKGIFVNNNIDNVNIFSVFAHICHTYISSHDENLSIEDLLDIGRNEVKRLKN